MRPGPASLEAMEAASSRRGSSRDAGSVSDSPAPTRPERSRRLGPAQPSRTREEAVRKRGQRGLLDAAGERGVPSTRAPQAERRGLRSRLGKQAERRSDPRASEGVLVNWVFAPSGAQGAELTIASGGRADGEQRGSKYVFDENAGGGIGLAVGFQTSGNFGDSNF